MNTCARVAPGGRLRSGRAVSGDVRFSAVGDGVGAACQDAPKLLHTISAGGAGGVPRFARLDG